MHIFVANLYLGQIYCWREEYQEAQSCYNKVISIFDKHGMFGSSWVYFSRIAVVHSKVMNNEKDIDLKALYSYAYQNKKRFITGAIKRYVGDILLNIDEKHIEEAEKWIIEAMEADKRHGMMFELGMDNALYSELFKRKRDQSKTRELLGNAIEIFKECGADGWVEKYEKEVAALQ